MPASPTAAFVVALQWAIVLGGALLFWRDVISPAARARRESARLAPWITPLSDLLMFLWLVICGGILLPVIAGAAATSLGLGPDAKTILVNAAYHSGMLLGVFIHRRLLAFRPPAATPPPPALPGEEPSDNAAPAPLPLGPALRIGALTLLTWMPIVFLTAFLWGQIMRAIGLPTDAQDSVTLFKSIKSPALLGLMILFAAVIAPINEEFIFRGGLFRYARTRLPRWAGFVLPACLFAALHGHLPSFAPLAVLGVVFSLAYERTGRLEAAIFAHALFNSYNVVCIFLAPELS